MKKTTNGVVTPIALICINKSRLKVYHKEKTPTYYLQKGQEFQIELFNPTSDTVLAKIHLNGNVISQGGLVLKPGQRMFLERYLDVAKKFMFDTYEVSNTEEVKKAIEDNGDIKVEFYRETQPFYTSSPQTWTYITTPCTYTLGDNYNFSNSLGSSICGSYTTNASINTTNATYGSVTTSNASSAVNLSNNVSNIKKEKRSIETGRIEAGSNSNQTFQQVSKTFDYFSFHTVEYKLLPVSQKINTSEDINVKRYCTNCGTRKKPEYKFCPSCGIKA